MFNRKLTVLKFSYKDVFFERKIDQRIRGGLHETTYVSIHRREGSMFSVQREEGVNKRDGKSHYKSE